MQKTINSCSRMSGKASAILVINDIFEKLHKLKAEGFQPKTIIINNSHASALKYMLPNKISDPTEILGFPVAICDKIEEICIGI